MRPGPALRALLNDIQGDVDVFVYFLFQVSIPDFAIRDRPQESVEGQVQCENKNPGDIDSGFPDLLVRQVDDVHCGVVA